MKISKLIGIVFWISCPTFADSTADWAYSGEKGPADWAKISSDYADCGGKNQSPMNLSKFFETELNPIDYAYQPGGEEILNNGYTVETKYEDGSSIAVDGIRFALDQFHFHAPSEHKINGESYPMEAHLVHMAQDGSVAVVAILFIEGEQNATLAQAWLRMPNDPGAKHALRSPIDAEGLLPSNRDYYRYNGSLTTPPCSEGVRWFVLKEPVMASKQKIEAFVKVMDHSNNRPVQPMNARFVLQ